MELTGEAFSYLPWFPWPISVSFLCVPHRFQLEVAFVIFGIFGCGDGEVMDVPRSELTRRGNDVKGRRVVRRDGAIMDTGTRAGSRVSRSISSSSPDPTSRSVGGFIALE